MESTLFNLSKTLNTSSNLNHNNLARYILRKTLIQNKFHYSSRINCIKNNANLTKPLIESALTSSIISLRSLYLITPVSNRLASVSTSVASFTCSAAAASGGGSDGFNGGGDSGGGGGGDSSGGGNVIKSETVVGDEVSGVSSDVIILDVGGMTCGGCAASVKRILESQPNVSSANVNLATETAIVWPVPEAKAIQNWQQQLGEALAKHLTNCGFTSNPRGEGAIEGNIA